MRLTNEIRDAFIKAVMSDVPKVDYQEQAVELARAFINSQMAIIFPGVDMEKAEPWLNQHSVYMPGDLRSFYTFSPAYDFLKNDMKLWNKLEVLNKSLQAQNKRRGELEDRLRKCAYAVTTRKALAELIPEFAHYLPNERTQAKMLPATTRVVEAFQNAGWPKKS